MPDVISTAPAEVRTWVAIDQHKLSLVAAMLPASAGSPRSCAWRAPSARSGGSSTAWGARTAWGSPMRRAPVAISFYRLLSSMGVACDVIAPSLIPVRPGDRVKTDRRDAKKLVRLYRAGELSFVAPPSPCTRACGTSCAAARICAARAPRRATAWPKALLRYGHIYREGKAWTLRHRAWVDSQRLADPLAHAALEHMLAHLGSLDAQLAALDHQLEQVATSEPWADSVAWLCCFRGISTHTALGLLAEIGDFRRFGEPRELMSYLGLTPSEYSSGQQQHRGHITKTGNRHARRLLVEAAWHYRHRPRQSRRTLASKNTSRRRSRPAPGRHKSVYTTVTGPSPNTASARPSRTSPSPAS